VIVREVRSELWLFAQRDHSALCGRMAEGWGRPPVEPVPGSVRLAADIHDSGWPEWDRLPRLDPETGWPHPYSKMPGEDYREIWRRGLARGWERGLETGLLVSLHAMRFFDRKRAAADRALRTGERGRQADALRALGAASADPDRLSPPYARWHDWMFFWDALSLFSCEGWDSPWTSSVTTIGEPAVDIRVGRFPGEALGGVIRIDPWPFLDALELTAEARVIPSRRYGSQADLDRAVDAAEVRRVGWIIEPGR
jgi:hypothetical protein